MLKIKKAVKLISIASIVLLFVLTVIHFTSSSSTVDCRGTVKTITASDDTDIVYITVKGIFDVPYYTIEIKPKTKVTTYDGEKFSVDDIRIGDEVLLDYWGKWESAEDVLTAKWIKIFPKNQGE